MSERRCRRCLLREYDEGELLETIRAYVENLPPELKADPSVYESRLQKCGSCEELTNGMCALCGCFVEVRAAKAPMHCAKSRSIW